MSDKREEKQGLTPHQERKALKWLNEVMRGERPAVTFRPTRDGSLHEVYSEKFIERSPSR